MTEERHPCADGLTRECFQKYPDWAKMMFAQKLMGTLFPPEITKNLPTAVTQAFGQAPPGWPAGLAMPPALGLAPPPGIIVPAGGVAAPMYTAIGAGGAGGTLAGRNVVAQLTPWFYDPFTTSLAGWTNASSGGGTCTIDAGRLKQYAPLPLGKAYIYRTIAATPPTTFDLTFDLTYDTDLGGTFRIDVYTGVHQIMVSFDPPDQIKVYLAAGWTAWTVDTFLGTSESWMLVYDETLVSLYRDTTAIFIDQTPYADTEDPGMITVKTTLSTIYLDELKIAAPYAAGASACD